MKIDIQQLYGHQMITFNGAVEGSLDYLSFAGLWLDRIAGRLPIHNSPSHVVNIVKSVLP
jgi:hypothetical protein